MPQSTQYPIRQRINGVKLYANDSRDGDATAELVSVTAGAQLGFYCFSPDASEPLARDETTLWQNYLSIAMSSTTRPIIKYGRRNLKSRTDSLVASNDSSDNDRTTTSNGNIDQDSNNSIPRKKRRLTRNSTELETYGTTSDARAPRQCR
jgi:hypothetical protein